MAAESLGALRFGYTRNIFPKDNEVVWVARHYNPREPRTTTKVPVPRHKFVYPWPERLPDVPDVWRLQTNSPIYSYRRPEERNFYPSTQATRCEEWSTLRQSLPSQQRIFKGASNRWGTGDPVQHITKKYDKKQGLYYPYINSPMTRYVDEMHVTNRLFKLH